MNIMSQFEKLKAIVILSGKKIGNNVRHKNSQNGNIKANCVYLVTTDTFKYFLCEATHFMDNGSITGHLQISDLP